MRRSQRVRLFVERPNPRAQKSHRHDVARRDDVGQRVIQRCLFRRSEFKDMFRAARIQKERGHNAGLHIKLCTMGNNLYLILAALDLSAPYFGTRFIPIGTVHYPFVARSQCALL